MSGGGMGGAKGGMKKSTVDMTPVQAPAAPNYAQDTAAADAAATKTKQALLLMQGKQSTILTDPATLGTATVGKRMLLGG